MAAVVGRSKSLLTQKNMSCEFLVPKSSVQLPGLGPWGGCSPAEQEEILRDWWVVSRGAAYGLLVRKVKICSLSPWVAQLFQLLKAQFRASSVLLPSQSPTAPSKCP